jgi:hypothetical protein
LREVHLAGGMPIKVVIETLEAIDATAARIIPTRAAVRTGRLISYMCV